MVLGGYGGLGRGVEERNVEATSAKTSVYDHSRESPHTTLWRKQPAFHHQYGRFFVISILLSFKTSCQFESLFS